MESPEIIGRYAVYEKIASGGMASVHLGRLLGPVGFSRTVAIKRMHPQFTGDPAFVSMFLDEARLAARIRHPNVVSTLDVVASNGELFLVLDYVQGETLAALGRRVAARDERTPVPIAIAILSGVLHGLHAAHEAKNEQGDPLGIVHRDVSPQNVMVGIDGVPRVLDFGVAKAAGRLQTTHAGTLKGKLSYMPQEQLLGEKVTRRCDIYAASVVLWETLAGRRLFAGDSEGAILHAVMNLKVPAPSSQRGDVPPELDAIVLRGLARDPRERFATAREMATALEAAVPVAIGPAVGAWVDGIAGDALSEQTERVARIESESHSSAAPWRQQVPDGSSAAAPVDAKPPAAPASRPEEVATQALSASQVSSVSVATPAGLAPMSSVRRTALVGVAAALAAATAAVFVMQARAPAPSAGITPPANASAPANAPVPAAATVPLPSAVGAAVTKDGGAPASADVPTPMAAVADTDVRKDHAPARQEPAPSPGPAAKRPPARPASPAVPSRGGPAYDPSDHL